MFCLEVLMTERSGLLVDVLFQMVIGHQGSRGSRAVEVAVVQAVWGVSRQMSRICMWQL